MTMLSARTFLIAAVLLLASSCWIGEELYRPEDARPVLAAGNYRLAGEAPGMIDSGTVRISIAPDGTTRAVPFGEDGREDTGDAMAFGLAPIDDEPRLAALWVTAMDGQPLDRDVRLYGLLRRNGDGSHSLFFPTCEGQGADAARAAGAEVTDRSDRGACVFHSRAQLEAALRAIESNLRDGFTLTPIAAN